MSGFEQYKEDFAPVNAATNFANAKMPKFDENQVKIIVNLLKEIGKLSGDKKLGTLLDVGCGCGVGTAAIAKYFDHAIGIDVSPNQIRIAQEKGYPEHVHFKTSGGENLPVADNSVDVLTVILALHFIDVDQFTKECRRVLKPQGVAILYTDLIWSIKSTENDKLPTIIDEMTEMKRKCNVIAEATSHPQRHFFDKLQRQFDAIDWPGKRKIETEFEFPVSMATIRDYHLSVPFYERLGKPSENPMFQVFEEAKRIWGMESVAAEDIEVGVAFSASVIVLHKSSEEAPKS